MSFYALQAPTEWAAPPTTWSSTSLDEIEACPRRWQLLHSQWANYKRFPTRPNPAAVEGTIVHDALDRLTRACGQRGNPPFGTAEFAAALAEADFYPGFNRAVAEWQSTLDAHPRPGPAFRLRARPEDLANRAVRMFREQYKPGTPDNNRAAAAVESAAEEVDLGKLLRRKGALSECTLIHPTLPFLGKLDRVQLASDGVEIVDYKTGRANEKHRRQLLRYALLWWRVTGERPVRISAQYLEGADTWPVGQNELEAVEQDLSLKISSFLEALTSKPANAVPGSNCVRCPVRARCSSGWVAGEEAAQTNDRGDAELLLIEAPGEHGFLARGRGGASVAVVYEAQIAKLLPPLAAEKVVRVLDGEWAEKRSQLELKAWSEVYVLE